MSTSIPQSLFYFIHPITKFEAQQGGNKRGGRTTDKMADSTASGPLWQQRPYPAPGTIMRSKESSVSNIGPSRGSRAAPPGHYGPGR